MESKQLIVNMLEHEYWWGGCVHDGTKMPFHAGTTFSRQMDPNPTTNPANTVFLSSKGRYIWCDDGFNYEIGGGVITITYTKAEPVLYDGYETLRGAFLAASKRHFPTAGKSPDEYFFAHPQYNTWIELQYGQSQEGVLEYAKSIIANGMPPGIIMIDDKWSKYYGDYEFDAAKFPEPKKLIDELHDMGFKVMIWVVPYITSDQEEFRYLLWNKGHIVLDEKGEWPSIKYWWNGWGAALDYTNPEAVEWYEKKLRYLMDEYGIDGFKFDGGDPFLYTDGEKNHAGTDANGQAKAFCEMALKFDFNELRGGYQLAGQPVVYRICDKFHSWETEQGIGALVPNMLAMGVLGYAYTCPDMIGGGMSSDFTEEKLPQLDQELFARYAQCAALMPMFQFSAAPWRVLDEKHFAICKEMSELHTAHKDIIMELVRHTEQTGEPIIRNMEYVFPGQGLEAVTDQFMLGDGILVAPVFTKGTWSRTVKLPIGKWSYKGETIDGGQDFGIDTPIDELAVFHRI